MPDSDNKSELLANLLKGMDLDAEDLIRAVVAASEIKKRKEEEVPEDAKVISEMTKVLERDDCWIYKDNRSKNPRWYINIYEPKYRRVWVKSLKTTNKVVAMAEAERIYAERKGRISVGARPTSITAKELIQRYQIERRKGMSDIPHLGITPKSFDRLCGQLKHWENYIKIGGHINTKIENIPTEIGLQFANYIRSLKKDNDSKKPRRSNQTTNQTVAAVKKMYKYAIEEKYVTVAEVPIFKYLKVGRETAPKRDVLSKDEREAISKWIQHKYCNEKGITDKERIKRRVWNLAFTIMHYTGCRPSELLKMKWADIRELRTDDKLERKINKILYIPQENSKTGRSRELVAPIGEQLNSLKKWYKQEPFSFDCTPDRYVFPRLTLTDIENNIPTTTVAWDKRIKATMKGSEEDGVWDSMGRRITLYSSRLYYITEAIMRGVTMNDIALNCGTSIQYIEETYSHITTTMRSKDITQGLGIHSMSEESKKKFIERTKG